MTAGKGYIGLATMIFGNWRPVPALVACLMFGFFDALATRPGSLKLPWIGQVSAGLVQVLPYGLTVVGAGRVDRQSNTTPRHGRPLSTAIGSNPAPGFGKHASRAVDRAGKDASRFQQSRFQVSQSWARSLALIWALPTVVSL